MPPVLTKPDVPGTVIRFVGEPVITIPPTVAETVAVPIVHDWGPLGSDSEGVKTVTSLAEFESIYGTGLSAGRTAVVGAFQGQGLPGQGGAGAVVVYRMAAPARAKATITVVNTAAATPALRLDAKYHGVRGNDLSVVVEDDPTSSGTRDILRIRFRGAVQETYQYAQTDINALRDDINRRSKWVDATTLASGTALTMTSGTSLAGGADGATLTATEWNAATAALEFGQFSILAPYNLTDTAVRATLVSWIRAQETANRPIVLVVGGAAAETLTDAITRSAAINDPHVVNMGVGTFHDDLLDADLSTAQLAPRVAGVLAARGEGRALTYSEFAGLTVVGGTGLPADQIRQAIDGGVSVFMRTGSPNADLRIAQGVSTYTTKTDLARPYDVFSEPRMVRIMDLYVRGMKQWGDDKVIGDLTVTQDTRDAVKAEARRRQDDLILRGLILAVPQPFVEVYDDPATPDAVPYQFGWRFSRTANYVIGEGRIN